MTRREYLPYLVCVTALCGAAALVYLGWFRLQAAGAAVQRIEAQVRDLKARMAERRSARDIVAESGARFRRWWRRGGWGATRLDWVAAAPRLAAAAGVPELDYTLGPRQTVWNQENLRLWRSEIELRLGLVHEGGLLALWRGLERAELGYFSLESCRIQRAGERPVPGGVNLTARCRLYWYGFAHEDHDDGDDGAVDDGPAV